MIKPYNETTFCIDLISDAEKTTDPIIICRKAKEILNIDIKVSQVIDYLNHTEDFEHISYTIRMRDIFG